MGVHWNDMTQKSLTSEYTDYMQFYKKNNDLPNEEKEKIKQQCQKYRNMMKDIFTSDYETWINFEAKGNMRLNKVVRGIFYRNCPLTKPNRAKFAMHPMFSHMATIFENLRTKHAKTIESRYRNYAKSENDVDPELKANLEFFRDM